MLLKITVAMAVIGVAMVVAKPIANETFIESITMKPFEKFDETKKMDETTKALPMEKFDEMKKKDETTTFVPKKFEESLPMEKFVEMKKMDETTTFVPTTIDKEDKEWKKDEKKWNETEKEEVKIVVIEHHLYQRVTYIDTEDANATTVVEGATIDEPIILIDNGTTTDEDDDDMEEPILIDDKLIDDKLIDDKLTDILDDATIKAEEKKKPIEAAEKIEETPKIDEIKIEVPKKLDDVPVEEPTMTKEEMEMTTTMAAPIAPIAIKKEELIMVEEETTTMAEETDTDGIETDDESETTMAPLA